jgi:hypothetical protein
VLEQLQAQPGPALPAGHLHGRGSAAQLRFVDDDAVRRRAAGAVRGLAVPARLARHLDLGGGAAAVDHPDLRGDVLFGFTLNSITLLALSVVVGILVDDAIVEIENIVRTCAWASRRSRRPIDAADEIGMR